MHGLFKFVGSRKPLGSALPGEQNIWAWATFTPDSRRLFAVYQSGRAFRWEVRPDAWSRKACEVAGRELTRLEWEDALPERDYRSVCE